MHDETPANPKKAITFITRGPKIKNTEETTDGLAKKVKHDMQRKQANHLTIRKDKMKTPVNATDVMNRKESDKELKHTEHTTLKKKAQKAILQHNNHWEEKN